MAVGLARAGARVGVLGRRRERAEAIVDTIGDAGGEAQVFVADVLREDQLEAARRTVLDRWGRIDILVNAAGGNVPAATVDGDRSFFDVPADAWKAVVDLNLLGTILPSQVFGAAMAESSAGSIVNISSMAASRALTRVGGYGAAKAAVESFTRWLAVELARSVGAGVRVNALAPGFFAGEQNRSLLFDPHGEPTPRAQTITAHTPAGRLGAPEDLVGPLIWLCSPASAFVTGAVIPVDGGFSAFGGV